ncbi:MAG: PfkB family carbohydrate kinase [Anaerolineae bacterium]|nr:PfkB family carbohydrate kinase [Anaerolineae bacterium]
MGCSTLSGPVEYLAIGHVTHDVRPDHSFTVGGTVSYAALTAAALGRRAGILTSAGDDFDVSVFNGSVAVACHRAAQTTTFTNTYVDGHRHQWVHKLADPLDRASVPVDWQQPRVAHIGPVIGECDQALVQCFGPGTFVGVTPQGYMRSQDGGGRVLAHAWQVDPQLLARTSAVVFSLDDIRGDLQAATSLAQRAHLLVVTMGARGGTVFLDGTPTPFPALDVVEVDPTGAGDIFAATFFDALSTGVHPMPAARFAACLASRSVTRVGIAGVPGWEDIEACEALLHV